MTEHLAPPIAAPLGAVETDRMVLRQFERGDLDALAAVFAHPEVWEFPYGRAFTKDETAEFLDAQMREWALVGFGCWLALHKATGQVLGYVGLSVPTFLPEILPAVEVGWRFAPAHWGQGYATEGASAALTEGFETLQLQEICSLPQATNPPSYRVCKRLGMRYRRTLVCPATDRRGAVDARLYTITRDGWRALAR